MPATLLGRGVAATRIQRAWRRHVRATYADLRLDASGADGFAGRPLARTPRSLLFVSEEFDVCGSGGARRRVANNAVEVLSWLLLSSLHPVSDLPIEWRTRAAALRCVKAYVQRGRLVAPHLSRSGRRQLGVAEKILRMYQWEHRLRPLAEALCQRLGRDVEILANLEREEVRLVPCPGL